MSKQFPSDKANFSEPLTPNDKQFVISVGPCQPGGPFPRDTGQKGRCFSASYYTKVNQAGVKIRRATLCYSLGDNCAYCQACWLFSKNRKSPRVTGFRDWRHLTYLLDCHENSADHIQCCVTLDHWRLNKTMSADMEDAVRKEVNYWRQVIERMINVTLMLASSNLAFRGHKEHSTDNENC